jgi:23S rRNA (adenine-N6)-dimethyltransferase
VPGSGCWRDRRDGRDRRAGWPPPNPAGAHFLVDHGLIRRLVGASGVGDGDLVLDLGAGYGALTGPLAGTGARVIAVELDPALAGRLRRRFAGQPAVRVAEADLRQLPWPRRPFHVVASPPFALTTHLCRRLLGDRAVRLAGAELVLGWGAANWLAGPRPADAQVARWAARYEISLVRRIPAACFSPPPASDAAQVSIRPRRSGQARQPSQADRLQGGRERG